MIGDLLTRSPLLYLLRDNCKYPKHLHHYLPHDFLHRLRHLHLDMYLEPSEEARDALEDFNERILALNNVLCCLCAFGFKKVGIREG